MIAKQLIGIYGGTFDPIHIGHLRTALELKQALSLKEVRLIPARRSPLRDEPVASTQDRLDLIKAALIDIEGLIVDDRELFNPEPSFTVNTLKSLRAELSEQINLCLIIGMDAFLNFANWYQPETILQLAHLIVAHRLNWQLPNTGKVAQWLHQRHATGLNDLINYNSGMILTYPVTALDISASNIRRLIASGHSIKFLVPDMVLKLISDRNIYQLPLIK